MSSEDATEDYFVRAFRNLFLYRYSSLSKLAIRALNQAAADARSLHPHDGLPVVELPEKEMEWMRPHRSFGPDTSLLERDGTEIEVVFEVKLNGNWNWATLPFWETKTPIDTPLAREIRAQYLADDSNVAQTDAYLAWNWWDGSEEFNGGQVTRSDQAVHILLTLDGVPLTANERRFRDILKPAEWAPVEIRQFTKRLNQIVEQNPLAISEEERKMVAAFTYVAYTAYEYAYLEDPSQALTPWTWLHLFQPAGV